jgi:hypothetical protein
VATGSYQWISPTERKQYFAQVQEWAYINSAECHLSLPGCKVPFSVWWIRCSELHSDIPRWHPDSFTKHPNFTRSIYEFCLSVSQLMAHWTVKGLVFGPRAFRWRDGARNPKRWSHHILADTNWYIKG